MAFISASPRSLSSTMPSADGCLIALGHMVHLTHPSGPILHQLRQGGTDPKLAPRGRGSWGKQHIPLPVSRIPTHPACPCWEDAHVGPVGTSMEDAAEMHSSVASPTPKISVFGERHHRNQQESSVTWSTPMLRVLLNRPPRELEQI